MRAKRFAKNLLRNDIVHLLVSDIHSLEDNFYSFPEAIGIASRIIGKDKIIQIVETFPAKVVNTAEDLKDIRMRNEQIFCGSRK